VFGEPGKASVWEPFANSSPSCLMLLAGAIYVPLHTTTPCHSLSMCLFENTEFLIEVLFCLRPCPFASSAVSWRKITTNQKVAGSSPAEPATQGQGDISERIQRNGEVGY